MYIPGAFTFEDKKEVVHFMQQHSFASLVSVKNGLPIATQLPFYIDNSGEQLILRSHLAKANEQTACLNNETALVIFSGPHAYISPKHYQKKESVPTWDYITVHAYGKATTLNTTEDKLNVLNQMIQFYEEDYKKQWDSLTDKYRLGMLGGMVAFEIKVSDLQAQKKLSQNKTAEERNNIINHLEKSALSEERALGDYIKKVQHELEK